MKTRISRSGILLTVALAAVLALAFLAYLQPSFVLDLANRFILC
jgi:hypothetical protein